MNSCIIAVDFDGTICKNRYPEIGEPINKTILYLKEKQKKGAKIVLWTCRVDELLDAAVKWCRNKGLIFDAVNENLPEIIAEFGGDTRKIFANEYIDDRNVLVPSENVTDIFYLCDGGKCGETCQSTECKHTSDISHAKNFVRNCYGSYWEKEKKIGQISEDMSQSDRMELWGNLIDVVEDWLSEKGITVDDIPNDEREDVEDAAIIFGDDYDYLADRFAEVIGISRDCVEEKILRKLCPNLDGPVSVSMTMPDDFDGDELKE